MVCSSSAWGCQPRAGAAEPGNAGASESRFNKTEDDETVLRVAYYNVGLQQTAMDTKPSSRAEGCCRHLANDIAESFRKHRLHLLCLCELGEHGIGLQGCKNMGRDTQHDLLELIVDMANEDLTGGASEPAAGGASEPADQVELVAAEYPTYAAIKRHGSKLTVEEVLIHGGLDTRPGDRPDHTMMTLRCR